MTDRSEMLEALAAAQLAILKRIQSAAAPGGSPSAAVADLARAYRHLAGGPQPGNTVVEK
jgi:cob(I)alamin adenosyltransferase